ncbi:potassium/sodium hyperpolarization-activated cyclic nucleotide-gated channel 2-like [Leptopilina boulardi]|uniref:potassium/sodium hyperpolarization-activated cyclic nucleotide-gated channel 2-like n=1 Tax=Leptopilina boulardi TaxID=63433 RepID=UPI0021F595B2|nr:potassium/sodium hyperpolarization-activated cyclic nucleotide-gated channel 2-like [Leptopilina boulardi]
MKALTTIYKNHPKCKISAISLSSIEREKKRQIESKHWWIIHPYSKTRFAWEIFMLLVYSFSFIMIPFINCFVIQDYMNIYFDNVNLGLYPIYWIDIIFNCVTGFSCKKKRKIELHQGKILMYYIKGYLLIDVITSIPYDRITFTWRKLPGIDSSILIDMINLLPMLKLLRYSTFNKYIFYLFINFDIKNFLYQIFTILLLFLFVTYWTACFCYVIPVLIMKAFPETEYNDLWISQVDGNESVDFFRSALYIVLDNFTASGYGLKESKSETHLIICTVLMIFGRLFECYLIVLVFQIRNEANATKSKALEIIDQVSTYANQKQLSINMKKRILSYYHYRFQNNYFRQNEIFSKFTDELCEEVILNSCRRLIQNVVMFHNLPKTILTSIAVILKPELHLENDVILKAGTRGDCMYFLARGTVAILTAAGKEICHLEDGAHFGEVALLIQDQKRVASVVAVDVCEVYRLDRTDFRKVIAIHSELFAEIERLATERIERTMLIEA